MSITQLDTTTAMRETGVAAVPLKFEVTTLPVADVDRAKAFYQRLGWRLDIDFEPTPDTRTVQFTPPGSHASIQFGQGATTIEAGPLQGLFLVVDDIEAARDELVGRGVDVSEIWHLEPGKGRMPASIRSAAPISAEHRSRTPTATRGSCRRSRSDSRAAWKCTTRGAGPAPVRDGQAPRGVRGCRPAARLVGLVRRLHGRARAGQHPGGGRRGRRALHGRRQARRRRIRLTPATDKAAASLRWWRGQARPSAGVRAVRRHLAEGFELASTERRSRRPRRMRAGPSRALAK